MIGRLFALSLVLEMRWKWLWNMSNDFKAFNPFSNTKNAVRMERSRENLYPKGDAGFFHICLIIFPLCRQICEHGTISHFFLFLRLRLSSPAVRMDRGLTLFPPFIIYIRPGQCFHHQHLAVALRDPRIWRAAHMFRFSKPGSKFMHSYTRLVWMNLGFVGPYLEVLKTGAKFGKVSAIEWLPALHTLHMDCEKERKKIDSWVIRGMLNGSRDSHL